LGYPSIAYLLVSGVVPYEQSLATVLAGFHWKDINTKFKNDFVKTQDYIDTEVIAKHGVDIHQFHEQLGVILDEIMKLGLTKLSPADAPPKGY
jgi:hypothetical protein